MPAKVHVFLLIVETSFEKHDILSSPLKIPLRMNSSAHCKEGFVHVPTVRGVASQRECSLRTAPHVCFRFSNLHLRMSNSVLYSYGRFVLRREYLIDDWRILIEQAGAATFIWVQ